MLERHEELCAEWQALCARIGIKAACSDPAFLAKICAAWPKAFDTGRLHEIHARLPRNSRGVVCLCGGWHAVPLWSSCSSDDGFRVDLYRSTGGRSAVACAACASETPPVLDETNVVTCDVCDGLGVVPNWTTNVLLGDLTVTWQQRCGGTWFPVPYSQRVAGAGLSELYDAISIGFSTRLAA